MTYDRALGILWQEKYELLEKEVKDWEHITALEMAINALEEEKRGDGMTIKKAVRTLKAEWKKYEEEQKKKEEAEKKEAEK